MNWIQHPVVLKNNWVELRPLDSSYFDNLLAAGKPSEIWTHMAIDGSDSAALLTELKSALLKRVSGEQYPFVIIDTKTGAVIGSTRLYDMFPEHRKLEVGWTWYSPAYWGTGHNIACKLLILTYCFEVLKTIRVQIKTSEHNLRSRAAIQKIGGQFEGILRNERIRRDGSYRNTAMYSITDTEWTAAEQMLEDKLRSMT